MKDSSLETETYSQRVRANYFHKKRVNPYSPNVTFLYPIKTSENLIFSAVFRGYRNVTFGEYGLRGFWISLYKSAYVPSSPLVFVVKGMFHGRIGFCYLTNIYCSELPMSELTGFITITYHNIDFWIKSNEEHG